ncbi:DNA-damage-inducible protein J [Devosia enhydra]|uniref:DNA-damage-inducible protein J n=1 Tax=Devosia enhydra TaxID=665118 RepID=A0A1K2I1E8_9HYPH|nr:type II toxin-antitoxin system RelB/DinJ family antitoxin [Devosia enhydra]SFZ86153.1 DNA-damage-inducible protein J [Devosia enhydra]
MADNAVVQARIDPEIKDKAQDVLQRMGLTLSDAIRILLTRTANEGALPMEVINSSAEYDAWFRAKVRDALEDPRPAIADADAERRMAQFKAGVLAGRRAAS